MVTADSQQCAQGGMALPRLRQTALMVVQPQKKRTDAVLTAQRLGRWAGLGGPAAKASAPEPGRVAALWGPGVAVRPLRGWHTA
jgi:hypothetical protein